MFLWQNLSGQSELCETATPGVVYYVPGVLGKSHETEQSEPHETATPEVVHYIPGVLTARVAQCTWQDKGDVTGSIGVFKESSIPMLFDVQSAQPCIIIQFLLC